jgi:VIT1/CCC1 family predicted Fe2+/Mn2+ transporter
LSNPAAPLIPYLLPIEATWQFAMAATLTLVVLFAVGSARSAVSELRWFRSGIEMLVVGAVAAGVAYGIGALVSLLTGQMPAA